MDRNKKRKMDKSQHTHPRACMSRPGLDRNQLLHSRFPHTHTNTHTDTQFKFIAVSRTSKASTHFRNMKENSTNNIHTFIQSIHRGMVMLFFSTTNITLFLEKPLIHKKRNFLFLLYFCNFS